MTAPIASKVINYDPKAQTLTCQGDWDLSTLPQLESALTQIKWPAKGDVTMNGESIEKMDSSGAWLINRWEEELKEKGVTVHLEGFPERYEKLLSIVEKRLEQETKPLEVKQEPWVARVGRTAVRTFSEGSNYLTFIGRLTFETLRITPQLTHWRWNSLTNVIYRNGFQALPIIALLSFMIGVVITYQMGLQLKNYGANIFIVDLLGISILREFAPLLTAIMVAGRTGSAFTAELGMMKLNQEIDALDTMGVTPAELLLIPRIIGLVIALPLLTVWGDIFGVFGGMIMSNNMLGITWADFLYRFPNVVPLKSLLIGVGKAPVFALLISSIGCYEGMQVKDSAESVGQNTTRSVVLSIFFIIVADAIFSVILSKLKL